MKLSILTAALQELTPRARRDADPDLAIEEWLEFARADRQPEHRAVRGAASDRERCAGGGAARSGGQHPRPAPARSTRARAARVRRAMQATSVGLSDLAYFDNMLAADESARRKKHELMLRVFDAAVLLGTDAVTGFVGRNPAARDGRQSRHVRGGVRAAAQGGQGARPHFPRRAVPHAGLERHRQLAQQHRLRARVRGLHCTASASGTASASSSASTTIPRTRS